MARASKGTVSIASQAGMLRLRWRYAGKPYTLTLGLSDTPLHRRIASGRAAEIQADIALERFDPTLKKYRQEKASLAPATTELWRLFTEHRRITGTKQSTIDNKYRPMYSNLERFGRTIDDADQARRFVQLLRSQQKALTANQNLSLLKGFGDWCVQAGHWPQNHFEHITPAKGVQTAATGAPFTGDEIQLILAALRSDPYYHHYHDVCQFLFNIGCRPSEAFALRWHQINLSVGTVTIYATKTDHIYDRQLGPKLLVMLQSRYGKPSELVFPSPNGSQIDPRNFRSRCWVKMLAKAGVPYRPPKFSRHSMGSHMIAKGATYPQVAKAYGHKSTRMVVQTYGRVFDEFEMDEF